MFIFDTCYFIAMNLMYATVEWRISFFFIQINLERRMNKRFTYIFDGINNFDFACWSWSEANYLLLFLRWNFSFFFFLLLYIWMKINPSKLNSKLNFFFQVGYMNKWWANQIRIFSSIYIIFFIMQMLNWLILDPRVFIIIIKTAEKNRSFMKADTNKKLKTKK